MKVPPNKRISKGVTKGAISVEAVVTETDSARFALARYDITFEAKPLGQQHTKMIPAAISGGKLNHEASAKPTRGIIVNWQRIPTMMPFGIFNTCPKSFRLNSVH